jgi:hypothetical protein
MIFSSRPHVDHRARHDRARVGDQNIDRIAVVGQRVRHETVVTRVAHRRVQKAIHNQRTGGLVHLVFDRFAADRHFDDDVHVIRRIVTYRDGIDAHGAAGSFVQMTLYATRTRAPT